jgi:hypothetical protein
VLHDHRASGRIELEGLKLWVGTHSNCVAVTGELGKVCVARLATDGLLYDNCTGINL